MASHSTFLSLPREIRDKIYEHYVEAEGGYVCNSEHLVAARLNQNRASESPTDHSIAGALKRADGRPIELDLAYTCKLVAWEMHGVALRTNPITFSTVTADETAVSDDIRVAAARFGEAMAHLGNSWHVMLRICGHSISETAEEGLKRRYPQFVGLLDRLREEGPLTGGPTDRRNRFFLSSCGRVTCGQAPSAYLAFCKEVLEAALLSPDGRERLNQICVDFWGRKPQVAAMCDVLPRVRCPVEHWAIPSKADMVCLVADCGIREKYHIKEVARKKDPKKYSFSAAAVSIQFLQSLPVPLRTQVRRIVLDEDREAVANPECHARGLIPFCKQNPLLRIERRVSLWRNAFHPDNYYASIPYHRCRSKYRFTPWELDSNQITRNFCSWIVEALALPFAGMPAGSFSLVLDGQPAPQLCAQIFQDIVQRDAAWQEAWTESVNRGFVVPPSPWLPSSRETERTRYPGVFFENFPQALRDMASNNSIVRCNFDVGQPWNAETIVREHRSWTLEQWRGGWFEHEPSTWQTVAPLPSWKCLVKEGFFAVAKVRPDGSLRDVDETTSDESGDSSGDE